MYFSARYRNVTTALLMNLGLAGLYVQTSQFPAAAKQFEKIVKLAPKLKGVKGPLCQVYRKLKRNDAAAKEACLAACDEVGISRKDCATP